MSLKIFHAYEATQKRFNKKKNKFTFIAMYSTEHREIYTYITSVDNNRIMLGRIHFILDRYDLVDLNLPQDEVIKLIEATEYQIAKQELYSKIYDHKEFISQYWDRYSKVKDLQERKDLAFKALRKTGLKDSRKFNLWHSVQNMKKFELMLDVYIFDEIKNKKDLNV